MPRRCAVTLDDLNFNKYPTTPIIDSNLLVLYQRLKQVEALWLEQGGHEFVCTSGLRSQGKQAELIKAGKSTATKSKHLTGCAADIHDEDGHLKAWLETNPQILMTCSLWCEAAESTTNWCHFQCVPPGSGRRWFIP